MKIRLTQQSIAAYRSLGCTEGRLQVQSQQTTGNLSRLQAAIVDCRQLKQTVTGSHSTLQVAKVDCGQPQQTAGSHSTLQVGMVDCRQSYSRLLACNYSYRRHRRHSSLSRHRSCTCMIGQVHLLVYTYTQQLHIYMRTYIYL